MNLLTKCISLVSYYEYTYLYKILPIRNDLGQSICEIAIATEDYDSTIHVDPNDRIRNLETQAIDDLDMLARHDDLDLTETQQHNAKCTLDHVKHWGLGSPTTCGYQHVGDESTDDVEIIQFFCCRGLGVCYRIHNYWIHLFLAYCFAHYTSVPLFVKNGKVYVGKYPGKSIFGWGEGRKLGSFTTVLNGVAVRRSGRNN